MQRLEYLGAMGAITIESRGDNISLIFDPNENRVSKDLSSTVQFKRKSLNEAVDALDNYLQKALHWKNYPISFFDPDCTENNN